MAQKSEEWPVIGIDLGTSYTCVGIWQHDRVQIIPNNQGNLTTPSQVAFSETERLIGEAAENQRCTNPTNTIFDAKRLIGRIFNDDVVQEDIKHWPFEVVAGPDYNNDKKPLIVVIHKGEKKQFAAEQISAMLLMKMKEIAQVYLGMPVKNVVVTVPAYFNDSQRQATKDAGTIAGLNVVRMINEPTAAAIAYGFEKKVSRDNSSKKTVLVFDLGGGTFDVSLVCIENDEFEVKAVGGDTHLGGGDFDSRLVCHLVEEFKMKYNKDVNEDSKAIGRLRAACERAKRALSISTETVIDIDGFFDGIDFTTTITRARFNNLNIGMFRECIDIVEECLSDAQIKKSDVDDIVLVGGSTRIPMVQQLLKEFFDGKELSRSVNPDEAVAYGAAVLAGILCGATNKRSVVLVDVTPLSLGVDVANGNMSVIIPKSTTIPAKKEKRYGASHTTKSSGDNQASDLEIRVYEGERSQVQENNYLGEFELSGISRSADGTTPLIDVCFEIDINGILNVSAEEISTGNKSEISISNRSRLTKAEMDKLMKEAEEYKAEDNKYAEMVEARNALEDYINDIWERVRSSSECIGAKDGIQQIREWLDLNSNQALNAAKYEEKMEELKSICSPYSSLMN